MTESKQNQPKSGSECLKYLIINPMELLDAAVTSRVNIKDDLVIQKLDERNFHVLKDGKRIIEFLDKLTNVHSYSIILCSTRKEHQINHALEAFDAACKKEGIKGFPKIATVVVKDRKMYPQVRASNLMITKNRFYDALVAGYGSQLMHMTEVLDGLANFINISEYDRTNCVVLDNQPSFVRKANLESWNAHEVDSNTLKYILEELYQREIYAKEHSSQKISLVQQEEAGNLLSGKSPDDNKLPQVRLASDIPSQSLAESQDQQNIGSEEEKGDPSQMVENSKPQQEQFLFMKAEKSDASNLKLDINFNNFQYQQDQKNSTSKQEEQKERFHSEIGKILSASQSYQDEKHRESKRLKEVGEKLSYQKNIFSQNPLLSDLKFRKIVKEKDPGGSSGFNQWFIDEESNTEWIGKLSYGSIQNNNAFDEYKEYLASQIYEFFGVEVPHTVLVSQTPADEIQKNQIFRDLHGTKGPKIHLMSKFATNFKPLGKNFIADYKEASKKSKKKHFCLTNEKNAHLRGFGSVMVVSILLHDYDFIGNSGTNIGRVPREDSFQILKLDPGEALTLKEYLVQAYAVLNPLENKEAVGGTGGERIKYSELNEVDQKEFVQTLKRILEVSTGKLADIFEPFLGIDIRFTIIFEELVNRKIRLLAVFSDEIENLIALYLRNLEEKLAEEHMGKWGQRGLQQPVELEQKAELIRNRAQLRAFTIVADNDKDASDTKAFQISQKKENFVGRDSELLQIKQLFNLNTGIIGCAIVGSPGLGKSHLAEEYILRNQKKMYSNVMLLHANKSELILDQIEIYLETCFKIKFDPLDKNKKKTIIHTLYKNLCIEDDYTDKRLKKSCIIFDDADNQEQISEYLPDEKCFLSLKIDILVTSRHKYWEKVVAEIIELQPFEAKDTENYTRMCFLNSKTSFDEVRISEEANRLSKLLGGLPLAISLAIAYIQQKDISISKFCDILEEENKNEPFPLLAEASANSEKEVESKGLSFVSTILTLALADLRIKNQNVESILDIIAYLSPDDISTHLLQGCWAQCREGPELSTIAEPSQKSTQGEPVQETLNEALNIQKEKIIHRLITELHEVLLLIFSYSLINFETTRVEQTKLEITEKVDKIKVHQLTQQVIRLNHQKSGVYEKNYQKIFDWIVTGLQYDEKDVKDIRRSALLVPHGIHLESLKNDINQKDIAKLFDEIGSSQFQVGKYEIASKYFEKSLKIKEIHYGSDHLATGLTLSDLGVACGNSGDYESQKDLLTRALDVFEKHYGKNHPQTATILNNLGSAHGCLGDYNKKKDLLIQALAIEEKHYGKDHPQTGGTLANLAGAYGCLGDPKIQKDLLTQALTMEENLYGKGHPQTAKTLANLGCAYGSLGDYERQRDFLTQALEIIEMHYGKDHPETAQTLSNLGSAWGDLGDYEKQKDILTRALAVFEKHYGKGHHRTVQALNNLGIVYGSLGDYEKQKDLFVQALEIQEKYYGKDHTQTASSLDNLGTAYGYSGDYERQKDLLTRALEIQEKYYGKDHLETAGTLHNIAVVYGRLGDYERQKDLLTRVLEIKEKYFGKDHPQTASALDHLGVAYGYLGDFERQKDLLTRTLEIKENQYGKDDPKLVSILENLGRAYGYSGDFEMKNDLWTRALEIQERHYGKHHPQTASTFYKFGNAYGLFGDDKKKKDLLTRALEIQEKHYGNDHPQTYATLESLESVHALLGDSERQRDLLIRVLEIKEKLYGKDNTKTMGTLDNLGKIYGSLGDYEKQRDILTQALKIKEKQFGKDHTENVATLYNLGNVYGFLRDYKKQKDLLIQTLEILEKHSGKDDPKIVSIIKNLGSAYGSLHDYKRQKDFLTRALEIQEKQYGKEDPNIVSTLENLGGANGSLHEYEGQKSMLTRALKIKEKKYGKDHPKIVSTLENLGGAYGSLHDYEKQRDLLTQALEIREKQYGKGHTKTVVTLGNLASAYGSLNDYQKQKVLLIQALEILERDHGKDHPKIVSTLENLGEAYGSLHDYERQREILTQVLEIKEKQYGKGHLKTAVTLHNLGKAYGSLSDYERQKDILTRALEVFEKHYGQGHPKIFSTLANLGSAYGSLHDYERQKDILTQALEIKEKHYGKGHSKTAATLQNLGKAYGSLGDYERQKDLLTQALDVFEKHDEKNHTKIVQVLNGLGVVYGSLGDYERQKDLFTQAFGIKEKHYGKGHAKTASALHNLGFGYGCLGDHERQKDFLTQALVMKEMHHGKDHPKTGITLAALGNALNHLGNPEEAKSLLLRSLQINTTHHGEKHSSSISTLHWLGTTLVSLNDFEQAESYLKLSLQINETKYGENHSSSGLIHMSLGDLYFERKNFYSALSYHSQAHKIFRDRFGENHKHTLDSTQKIEKDQSSIVLLGVLENSNSLNKNLNI